MKRLIFFAILLFALQTNFAQSIDTEASKITFEISNMGLNTVKGSFGGMNGMVEFDANNLDNSKFDVCINAESVDTDNRKRDDHLRKEDFFYVESHPTICFQSNSITKTSEGYITTGTLSMRGISKEVSIPFTFSDNTFNGTLSLKRKDYKVGPSGGFMVGKTVDLKIICVLK
ncbi:MAG: YceI family protein [Bacteroidota bacterium]